MCDTCTVWLPLEATAGISYDGNLNDPFGCISHDFNIPIIMYFTVIQQIASLNRSVSQENAYKKS